MDDVKSLFSVEYERVFSRSEATAISDSPFIWDSGRFFPVWDAARQYSFQNRENRYIIPVVSSVWYYVVYSNRKFLSICERNLMVSKNINTGRNYGDKDG